MIKKIISVLCEFHIIPRIPHTVPHVRPPPNREKKVSRGSYSVSQCVLQNSLWSTLLCLQTLIAMARWSGMRLLLLCQYWTLSGIPLGCLVAVLCDGGPVVLDL